MTSRRPLALLVLAALALVGCSDYTLEGRVMDGSFPGAFFVNATSEQLDGDGLAATEIRVYRDAGRPNQSLVATGRSDSDGWFSVPLHAFGAGWMLERWMIQAIRPGYETVESVLTLPSEGEDRRLVITMMPGVSITPSEGNELIDQYEKFR